LTAPLPPGGRDHEPSELARSRPFLITAAAEVRPGKPVDRAAKAQCEAETMAKKLYVGNISFDTTSDDLVQAFSQYGTVLGAQIVSDRETGRSRGFAFVEMHDGAEAAIAAMNGAQLQGRTLTVNEARPREERPRNGGGGGGGGYGGGGGGSRRY
jgi:RNA recognition motif-containing protein